MDRESFIFYRSFYEAIKCMPPEVQAEIYPAICEYALFGKVPKNLSEVTKGMFTLIKPNIDANTARFENGKKGGRKKKTKPASSKDDYSMTYEQEVEQMRNDDIWRKSICDDFSITAEEYDKRLSRFLDRCNEDKERKRKLHHDSFADCQSHLRYWMTKAFPQQSSSAPLADSDMCNLGPDFGAIDYDNQNNNTADYGQFPQ